MLELDEKFSHEKFRKKCTRVRFLLYTQYAHGHLELLHPFSFGVLRLTEELEALLAFQMDQVEAIGPLHGAQTAELTVHRFYISHENIKKTRNLSQLVVNKSNPCLAW